MTNADEQTQISPEEYEAAEARAQRLLLRGPNGWAYRSCGWCNPAHEHLHREPEVLLLCFECGDWWLGPINLTTQRKLVLPPEEGNVGA